MSSALTRWLYRLTIPWIWLAVAFVSWRHPGDECGLFAIANGLPSGFLFVLFGTSGRPDDIFVRLIACSFVAMLLLSWPMDRLRVPWWLTVPLWMVAASWLFSIAYGDFESHARAIAKNGSMTAYISASSNLGLFLACVLGIVLTAGYHTIRRFLRVRSAETGSMQTVIAKA